MSESYLGEIRMFGGNFAPQGWALCQGQLLNISENEALFTLLGTSYGGDGQTTFALPDLQGRIAVHPNSTYPMAAKGGSETITLTTSEIPKHTHVPNASSTIGTVSSPLNAIWAATGTASYSTGSGILRVNMNPETVLSAGENRPHDNMMPTLTISFIIALQGIFPSQA